MHRIAIQFGHPTTRSRLITVLGAIEGCGATTIALNLASEIGRLANTPCILGEGAVSFGRLANYLNITPSITLLDLLSDVDHLDAERVRRALTKVDDHLQVLTGSYRGIVPFELNIEAVYKLLSYAKEMAEFIVVDGRYQYAELDFDFMDQSQQIVLVAKPTVPSLYALRMLLDLLAERECLAQQFVVINQFESCADSFSVRHMEEGLQATSIYTVTSDPGSIRMAENTAQTLHRAAPRSRALADVTALARAILSLPAKPRHQGWSFLQPLEHLAQTLHLK